MKESVEKQGYLLEDFRLFHLQSAAGVRTEYHYHEFCKILLLLSGSGSYWIEGQQYSLQPGDIVLVGSGCVHRPELEPGVPYERIILYISPEFLRRSSRGDCQLLECFSGDGGHVLRAGQSSALFRLADDLEAELSSGEYGREILSSSLLLRLLVQISRIRRQGIAQFPPQTEPQDPRVARMIAYIRDHLAEDLNIPLLAEQCYLSQYHMMRLFRTATGTSINTYITHQRLKLARTLIAGGLPATESCFRAGFGSYSSFTRAYSKFFGTTPTGRKYAARLLDESYE